jgi:hypothetical protein
MTSAPDFKALADLFEEACALNREALAALDAGRPVQDLSAVFERKRLVTSALTAVEQAQAQNHPWDSKMLYKVRQLQREAALLEAQLSEALGNAVSRSGKALEAYKKTIFDVQSKNAQSEY